MRFAKTLMGVAAALFIGGAASAATVKVTYEGTIDYLEGFVSTPIALGQRITLTQIIDTDASPLGQAGNPSEYPFLGGSFTNHDLGHTSVYDAAIAPHPIYNSIRVFADSTSGDQYTSFSLLEYGASGENWENTGAFLNLPIGQTFGTSSLAPFVSYLQTNGASGLSTTNGSLQYSGFGGTGWWGDCSLPQRPFCDVLTQIDTLTVTDMTAVPVPAALPLMVLGLAGLGFAGRRRGRID